MRAGDPPRGGACSQTGFYPAGERHHVVRIPAAAGAGCSRCLAALFFQFPQLMKHLFCTKKLQAQLTKSIKHCYSFLIKKGQIHKCDVITVLLHVNRAKRAQRAPKRLICVCCPSAGMAVEWQQRKPNVRTHCTGASASARHPPAGTCPPQLYASLPLLLPRPALICRQAASHVTEEKGDNGVSLERVFFFFF